MGVLVWQSFAFSCPMFFFFGKVVKGDIANLAD